VRRRAREAGAFGLLEKPLLGDELLETVRRATMTRP
jgi:FixJ family two-component response regulator